MAKLPDETAFGGSPQFQSGRPVATYDTTAIGKGISNFGESLTAFAKERQEDAAQIEYLKAKGLFFPKNIELQAGFEKDPDHPTYEQRYQTEATKARDEAASAIRNPRLRQRFLTETADDLARGHLAVRRLATARETDQGLAGLATDLDKLRDTIFKAPTEEDKTRLIESAGGLIDAAQARRWVSDVKAVELKKAWTENYARDWLKSLQPEERKAALGGGGPVTLPPNIGGLVDSAAQKYGMTPEMAEAFRRTAWIESKGNPSATSPTGAAGVFQFTRRTGQRYGLTPEGRYDPAANVDAAARLWNDNARRLQSALGRNPTGAELYLAHQQGAAGAIALLSNGEKNVVEALAPAHEGNAAEASRAISVNGGRPDMTAAEFVNLWGNKFAGGGKRSPVEFIPAAERQAMLAQTDQEIATGRVKVAQDRAESWERSIIDAASGNGTLPDRAQIASDPALDEPRRNTLLRQYDSAAAGVQALRQGLIKFADPQATFNPFDKTDKASVDQIFTHFGGDVNALQQVVDRTGMVPSSAGTAIRGALVSNDPKRVGNALSVVSNLMARSPTILAGVDGREDIEGKAVAFQHHVKDLGRTADEAAQRIIEADTPEYKAKSAALMKNENIQAILKKQTEQSVLNNDIEKHFATWWQIGPGRPDVESTVEARAKMIGDYAELVKEKFLSSNGDMALAKKQALQHLETVWGVSTVSGKKVIMRWAPEKAPAYHGIPDVSERIAKQAADAIFEVAGEIVPREKIRLEPVLRTAGQYNSGQPPHYRLWYTDKNGSPQVQWWGGTFYADPQQMQEEISRERQKGMAAAVTSAQQEAGRPAPGDASFVTGMSSTEAREFEKSAGERKARNAAEAAEIDRRRAEAPPLSSLQDILQQQGARTRGATAEAAGRAARKIAGEADPEMVRKYAITEPGKTRTVRRGPN